MLFPLSILMITNFKLFVDKNCRGSSFISPAHGRDGARASSKNSAVKKSFRLREGAAGGGGGGGGIPLRPSVGVGAAPLSCSVKRSKAKHFSIPFRRKRVARQN